jgi:glycerophosphoryl diester phosphodiesterase
MLNLLPSPTFFAHRGASAYAPENTMAAFDLALRQGAEAIELDAKLTADGKVVVIHDQTINRTTEGDGRVKDLTFAQLRELDAGSHFDFAFRGEPIPSLDEVFAALGHLLYINVELTNYNSITDSLPEKVANLVKRHNLSRRVIFSSFNPIALVRIRRAIPEAPIGLLAQAGSKGAWARSWAGRLIGANSLNPEVSDVTQSLIEANHRIGRRVFVWTVNQAEEMRRLFALKVDGIFTDDPVLARQILSVVKNT